MPNAEETVLEIDLSALQHNFEYLSSKLKSSTRFLAVVKAFAYGNDAKVIANFLQDLGVDYFAVAYVHEGVALRDAGITKPILVLHPQPVNFKVLIDNCLEPTLYSARVLTQFISIAEKEKQTDYPVHIKFNTGLNRLGFWESDVDYIISKLNTTKGLIVKSIFSHLAASEDLNEKDFTRAQIKNFNKITSEFRKKLRYSPLLHMCNTSGILNYSEAHFDMVRSGIGLYGFGNSKKENQNLIPVATLKSVISQIHKIEKGESVGYNRAFVSKDYGRIATIPVGHADGIGRQYGNSVGYVTINGKRAPIIGNVCMDMLMADISGIDCNEGDQVIIFGKTPSAEEWAEMASTISYELITAVSQRVKRNVIQP